MSIEELAQTLDSPSRFAIGVTAYLDQKRDDAIEVERERIRGADKDVADDE